jgi:hypothetical protein
LSKRPPLEGLFQIGAKLARTIFAVKRHPQPPGGGTSAPKEIATVAELDLQQDQLLRELDQLAATARLVAAYYQLYGIEDAVSSRRRTMHRQPSGRHLTGARAGDDSA